MPGKLRVDNSGYEVFLLDAQAVAPLEAYLQDADVDPARLREVGGAVRLPIAQDDPVRVDVVLGPPPAEWPLLRVPLGVPSGKLTLLSDTDLSPPHSIPAGDYTVSVYEKPRLKFVCVFTPRAELDPPPGPDPWDDLDRSHLDLGSYTVVKDCFRGRRVAPHVVNMNREGYDQLGLRGGLRIDLSGQTKLIAPVGFPPWLQPGRWDLDREDDPPPGYPQCMPTAYLTPNWLEPHGRRPRPPLLYVEGTVPESDVEIRVLADPVLPLWSQAELSVRAGGMTGLSFGGWTRWALLNISRSHLDGLVAAGRPVTLHFAGRQVALDVLSWRAWPHWDFPDYEICWLGYDNVTHTVTDLTHSCGEQFILSQA